jgi:hypothetical protein
MKRISSRTTFLQKYLVPPIFLIFFATFILQDVSLIFANLKEPLPLQVIFVVIPVIWCLSFLSIWRTADIVYDCGDHLLVRKGHVEDRVMLSNITKVSRSFFNPQLLVLELRAPSPFGEKLSFIPSGEYRSRMFFVQSWSTKDLIRRIDEARQRSWG